MTVAQIAGKAGTGYLLGSQRFVNRPLGVQSAGPWVVDAAPEELAHGVFADAQHACNPAWTTVSRFYR